MYIEIPGVGVGVERAAPELILFLTFCPPTLPIVPTFPPMDILSPDLRLLLTFRSIRPVFCTGVLYFPWVV